MATKYLRYHVDKHGDPARCDAEYKCRARGFNTEGGEAPDKVAHFVGTLADARKWAESENSKKHSALSAPVKRHRKKKPVPYTVTEGQKRSASAARVYQKARLEKVLSEYLTDEQAIYDATEAGELELKRRLDEEKRKSWSSKEVIDSLERRQEATSALKENPEYYKFLDDNDLTEEESSLASETILNSQGTDWKKLDGREDKAIKLKHALVDKSAQWVERLTPEETEALSWHTSNGSSVMRMHSQDKEHHIWGYNVYSKQYLEKTRKHLESAFAKAPELDEPVTLYRGVDLEEAEGIEVDDLIENNEYMSPTAESFSLSAKTAQGFSGYGENNAVILKLETKKIATPACVSAWGAQEYEVLSSPNSRYKVVGKTVETLNEGLSKHTIIHLEEEAEGG